MYCVKCGKELKEGTAFCSYCGTKQEQDGAPLVSNAAIEEECASAQQMTEAAAVEKPALTSEKKRLMMVATAAVAVALCIGVGIHAYNKPEAQMNRALKTGNLELAYEIYDDNFYGEELSDKSVILLEAAAAKIADDYLVDTITYEDAERAIFYLWNFDCNNAHEIIADTEEAVHERHSLLTYLENAVECYDSEDYTGALYNYQSVLDVDAENVDALAGLEKTKTAYRQSVLDEAEIYAKNNQYDDAIKVLEYAGNGGFAGSIDFTVDLEKMRERQATWGVVQANTAADGGDWDEALSILERYQNEAPDSPVLKKAVEDITARMPITLRNVTTISFYDVNNLSSVVTDRYGNVYDGATRFVAGYGGYSLYNLNKKYTTFTGTVFVENNNKTGIATSIAIYLDEQLVYYKEGITEETAPVALSINVTGATTMRITTDGSSAHWSDEAVLMIADTNFAKVDDQTAKPADTEEQGAGTT